jgi:hypothetical protein
MTLPSEVSDWLIALPSLSIYPEVPAEMDFSEPAKSTKLISDSIRVLAPPVLVTLVNEMVTTVWALDEVAFIWVAPTERFLSPLSI